MGRLNDAAGANGCQEKLLGTRAYEAGPLAGADPEAWKAKDLIRCSGGGVRSAEGCALACWSQHAQACARLFPAPRLVSSC